jgi:hypothetical protein
MPYKLLIDININCAFIRHDAPFDLSNIAKSSDDRLSHPDFKKGTDFLHDLRSLIIPVDTSFKIIAQESKRIIREYNQRIGACKGAMVVGDGQSYAKIHQFIESGRFSNNPIERKVFRDIQKAFEWLEIPQDYEIDYTAKN